MSRQIKALFIERIKRAGLCPAVVFLVAAIIASCAAPLFAAERIILVQAGTGNAALWNGFKKYLAGKGYTVSAYEAATTMEKQVETANRINRERAGFMLVLEMLPSEKIDVLVAVSDAKKGKGMILNIEEVPGLHIDSSKELATSIADQFQEKLRVLPLFTFLGIDMPGVFLRLGIPKDKTAEAFGKVNAGMAKYLKRGIKDERERKSERRDTQP